MGVGQHLARGVGGDKSMTVRNLVARWSAGFAVGAVTVASTTFVPAPVHAAVGGPAQADPGAGGPLIHINVDVASDEVDDVNETVDDLLDNVREQLRALRSAEEALGDAEDDLADAREQVAQTEGEIALLVELSDEIVAGAFVSASGSVSFDALVSDSMSDLAVKQTLRRIRFDEDADILQELADARERLEEQKEEEEALADAAEGARDRAAAELGDLEAAVNQQTAFLLEVEDRLERGASEALSLEDLDPDLAAQLVEERDALADTLQEVLDHQEFAAALDRLAEAAAAREAAEREAAEREAAEREAAEREAAESQPPAISPPSGNLATVSCPSGGSITVDSSLAANLEGLLAAASADGLQYCGGGYRDPQEQIRLREAHCGTSHYAIYEMPASQCSPPTARPGSSMHERGLAVDFNCNGSLISSRGTTCFTWLANNASRFGLANLPSEPWHWSTNGN